MRPGHRVKKLNHYTGINVGNDAVNQIRSCGLHVRPKSMVRDQSHASCKMPARESLESSFRSDLIPRAQEI